MKKILAGLCFFTILFSSCVLANDSYCDAQSKTLSPGAPGTCTYNCNQKCTSLSENCVSSGCTGPTGEQTCEIQCSGKNTMNCNQNNCDCRIIVNGNNNPECNTTVTGNCQNSNGVKKSCTDYCNSEANKNCGN